MAGFGGFTMQGHRKGRKKSCAFVLLSHLTRKKELGNRLIDVEDMISTNLIYGGKMAATDAGRVVLRAGKEDFRV